MNYIEMTIECEKCRQSDNNASCDECKKLDELWITGDDQE